MRILIVLVILALLGGGGFFGYQKFYAQDAGAGFKSQLENVSLKEELLLFSFQQLPEIYTAFVDFGGQIRLMKDEIERLNIIEQEYPKQVGIIQAEKQLWNSVMNDAGNALTLLENEIESIFVTFKVNAEKGQDLIKAQAPELAQIASKALEASQSHTERLVKKGGEKSKFDFITKYLPKD